MTAKPTPTTHPVEKLEDGLAVWYCDCCRVRYPHLGRDSWQFVNKTGDCPRCTARAQAEGEQPNA